MEENLPNIQTKETITTTEPVVDKPELPVKKKSHIVLIVLCIILALLLLCFGISFIILQLLNNAINQTTSDNAVVITTVTPTTSTITTSQTPNPTETALSGAVVVTATIEADSSKVAEFKQASLPRNLKFPFTKVVNNLTTPVVNVVYLGKYQGTNVIYYTTQDWNNDKVTVMDIQKADGSWNEYFRESDTVTPSVTPVKFSEITDKYQLLTIDTLKSMFYLDGQKTDIANGKLFFNISYDENLNNPSQVDASVKALILVDLKSMKFERIFIDPIFPKNEGRGIPTVGNINGNYTIIALPECSQCDEAKVVLMIINWQSGKIKYLGEGEQIGEYKIDTVKNTITYKPQVFADADCNDFSEWGSCGPRYSYKSEVTIQLP